MPVLVPIEVPELEEPGASIPVTSDPISVVVTVSPGRLLVATLVRKAEKDPDAAPVLVTVTMPESVSVIVSLTEVSVPSAVLNGVNPNV